MAKAKFDIKTEATRPLYAGVGVTDLAVARVRGYVADVQKRVADVQKDVQVRVNDFQPKTLRDTAVTLVTAGVDALANDAKALPTRVQSLLNENVDTATETYTDLAKRGETLVARIRRQQATQATVSSAKTTTAKAKTTRTQATKATKTTAKKTAQKASTTVKKTSTAPRSSAKATGTSARKTAANAAKATTDAASKVGN